MFQNVFARYLIVVDAGSSGSRLHLFSHTLKGQVPVINDIFSVSAKPGISAYAHHPEDVGLALNKLFADAKAELTKLHIDTHDVSVSILATAGMRMLPYDQQQAIYTQIKLFLKNAYDFQVNRVETISGQQEGLYGWLDINYLQENFQQQKATVGSIDMGGASTQIAFATDANQNKNIIDIKIGDVTYHVFSKSFLGLGQDQARAAINAHPDVAACYPLHFNIGSQNGRFNFSTCQDIYHELITQQHVTDKIIMPAPKQTFIGYSGIYYAYDFFAVTETRNQNSVEKSIVNTCSQSWEQLLAKYPQIATPYLSAYCANGSYIDHLIYKTYQLQDTQLVVAKSINGKDIDWTLGAVLYQLAANKI